MRRPRRYALLAIALAAALTAHLHAGFAAATKSSASPSGLRLHGIALATVYPGTSATVRFTVDNPSKQPRRLTTIHLASVVACDTAFISGACPRGHENTSCESIDRGDRANRVASNFYMADIEVNQDVDAGDGQAVALTGTLTMNNLDTNQDGCKNSKLQLNFV